MNPWGIHSIGDIYHPGAHTGTSDGRWVVAVAEPYTAGSLRAAWWVLTGRAFALRWPRPGDLEDALSVEPQHCPRQATTETPLNSHD
jgi:hypothetical protein